MRSQTVTALQTVMIFCACLAAASAAKAADAPSPDLAFSFKPVQKNVEYETPPKADFAKCQIKVERKDKISGWVVTGPSGQILRRFLDTNGDNLVDQWRYYLHGLEVYRDVDANFNNKVDNSRWLNTGGSRWGVDTNEDGRIDEWKVISAQEAGREAFEAMKAGDERAMSVLCLFADDVKKLGIKAPLSEKLLESVASPGDKMRKIMADSKVLTSQTRWTRFDSSTPSVIPADEGKAGEDLVVYENAMAIVEIKGKSELVQIGELVRIGDAWKLTQIPQPLEGNSVEVTLGGILMQPTVAMSDTPTPVEGISPEMQKLLKDLQALDENSPSPSDGPDDLAKYNRRRADLLEKLIDMAKSDEDRDQWTRQMVASIAASVQTGAYPAGFERLKQISAAVVKRAPDSQLVAYLAYRILLAQYANEMRDAKTEDHEKLQEKWLKDLEDFATKYPTADDTPDALLQLAIAEEFAGHVKESKKWYEQLTSKHGETGAGTRAEGALRRLDMEGKPFTFSASGLKGKAISSADFRGKVLLVIFWSTWCKPCTEDLPQIRALYDKYHAKGFEILGVNLDSTLEPVDGYLSENKVVWPQVYEPGGLESGPAMRFGIISLPTMFLVGSDGKVVSRSTSVDDLKTKLPELLKAK